MPAYPSIAFITKKREPVNPIDIELTDGGKPRAQDFSAKRHYEIEIEHQWLTQSEVDTLLAFFATNENVTITTGTLSDGNTYDCLHVYEPEEIALNGTFFHVRQRFVGSKTPA